jgi:sporulation protein YlmC with PRC-barrel domain
MKREKTETQRIEELLGKKIVTASGKVLGHVFDIQLSRDGAHRVTDLMYGQRSLLFRLHVYKPISSAFHLKEQPKTIPWEAVERVERSAVCLKAGYD